MAVPRAPIVGERNCRSLKNILMPSSLPPPTSSTSQVPACFKCTKNKCVLCKEHLTQTNQFCSSTTKEKFTIRGHFNCDTNNIVYLLWCNKCDHAQYVGETKNSLKKRFYLHRSHIGTNKGTHVTRHFNKPDHSLRDVSCIVIEKVLGNSRAARLKREDFWRKKLRTVFPEGLNTMDS